MKDLSITDRILILDYIKKNYSLFKKEIDSESVFDMEYSISEDIASLIKKGNQ